MVRAQSANDPLAAQTPRKASSAPLASRSTPSSPMLYWAGGTYLRKRAESCWETGLRAVSSTISNSPSSRLVSNLESKAAFGGYVFDALPNLGSLHRPINHLHREVSRIPFGRFRQNLTLFDPKRTYCGTDRQNDAHPRDPLHRLAVHAARLPLASSCSSTICRVSHTSGVFDAILDEVLDPAPA